MIPAPILFGALIDRTCLSWQELPCTGERGSCFTYDNWSMGTYLLALVFTCKGLSLFFFVFAHFLYRPPPATSRSLISETNVTTSTTCTDYNSPSSILLDQKSPDDINVTLLDKKSTTNPWNIAIVQICSKYPESRFGSDDHVEFDRGNCDQYFRCFDLTKWTLDGWIDHLTEVGWHSLQTLEKNWK